MAHKREMARDTLYLSIYNFDRATALQDSLTDNKQIEVLSLLSLWMASKVSEQRPISLKMLPLCVNASSYQELVREEAEVLKQLKWKIQAVTPDAFLEVYCPLFCRFLQMPSFSKCPVEAQEFDEQVRHILDLVMFLPRIALYEPQVVAFSAIAATYYLLSKSETGKGAD